MATERRDPRATAATIRSRSGTLAKRQRRLYRPSLMLAIVRTTRSRLTTTGKAGTEKGPLRRSKWSASARYAATTIPIRSIARRYRPRSPTANRTTWVSGGVTRALATSPPCPGAGDVRLTRNLDRSERRTANRPHQSEYPNCAAAPARGSWVRSRDRRGNGVIPARDGVRSRGIDFRRRGADGEVQDE